MREKCDGGLPDDELQDEDTDDDIMLEDLIGKDAEKTKAKTKKKRKLKLKAAKATPAKIDEYILGPERFPLDQERFGYLPIAIQKFLHTDNENVK